MTARALLIFLATLLVVGAVYRRVPSNFLRAESGWYLVHSHGDDHTRSAAAKELGSFSFNGHYTPVAFLAEFQMARWIGTNGTLWRARQIIGLAVAAAGVFAFGLAVARRFGVPRAASGAIGLALSASVAFQPAMIDFISWPFMILQLVWIASAALVLYALVRFGRAPAETRSCAVAAATAYASLHISGLGLVLVGATAAVGTGMLLVVLREQPTVPKRSAWQIGAMLGLMLALTALHVWLTLRLDYAPAPAVDAQLAPARLQLLFGFVWQFAIAGALSFFPTVSVASNGTAFAFLWPCGAALLLGFAAAIAALWRRAVAREDQQAITSFVLHTFSIAAFCVLVLLVLVRVRTRGLPELGNELANFTWGPRYIIPLHTALLGSGLAAACSFARHAPRAATPTLCALALAAAVAASQPISTKNLSPQATISHDAAWELLLETVRECRAQNLPVPDVPLGALAQEFADVSFRRVEPLVRHDLQIAAGDPIAILPWPDYVSGDQQRYRAVKALKRLQRKLGLLPSKKS